MKRGNLYTSAQLVMFSYMLAACTTTGTYPAVADINAVTEKKPLPPATILTDPAANDRYNSALEAYGDRLHAAGLRLCRYFQRTGMKGLDCK